MYLNSRCSTHGIESNRNSILSYYFKRKSKRDDPKKTDLVRDYTDCSDIELIDLYVKDRDERAFDQIYNRYYKIVLGTVFKSLNDTYKAEDITQEVFIKLVKNAGKFRKEAKFSTWLLAITHNTIKMTYRKMNNQKRTVSMDDDDFNITESEISDSNDTAVDNAENIVITREIAEKLNEALKQIPDKSKEVFLLREQMGHTNPEIASELGISLHAVKARLFRTRVQIKNKLDNLNLY